MMTLASQLSLWSRPLLAVFVACHIHLVFMMRREWRRNAALTAKLEQQTRSADGKDKDEDESDLSCTAAGLGQSAEKHAMLEGRLYKADDALLTRERKRAQQLVFRFNATGPQETERRQRLARTLLPCAHASVYIEPPFRCDYGHNIELGAGAFVNYSCVILDCAKVIIGANTLLAPKVQVYTARHPLDPEERLTGKEYASPVTIGANCWLGGGSIVCPGVTIGDNVVVGAGSVVTKDLPDNVVAVGNPCRVLRQLKPPLTDPRSVETTWA